CSPADDSYLQLAREEDLRAEVLPMARMNAVIAVKKGNPRKIASLDDLLKGENKLAQANPDAAAIGKLTREMLKDGGVWNQLKERTTTFTGTVNEAANAVAVGSVDAAIVWDVTVKQTADLEAVTDRRLAK